MAARRDPAVALMVVGIAVLFVLAALVLASLTLRDEGQWLSVRFGPLPLLRRRIRYVQITSVEPGRTAIIDGWGVHYIIGRGWTYNIWGFACVKLTLGKKVIRLGTDDVNNLMHFLKGKVTHSTAADGERKT